jgi:hypothetical protein
MVNFRAVAPRRHQHRQAAGAAATISERAVLRPNRPLGHRWDRSARRVEKLRARLKWGASGTLPIKPRGMQERTYQRILELLAYYDGVRSQGASYARKYRQISIVPSCGTRRHAG